jgi:hypothetical protein
MSTNSTKIYGDIFAVAYLKALIWQPPNFCSIGGGMTKIAVTYFKALFPTMALRSRRGHE